MTRERMFERQVRPVRVHLTLDRGVYLCGYVQRSPDPEPPYETLPLCGPCWVALHLLQAQMANGVRSCQRPDLSLEESVALLLDTEWETWATPAELVASARQGWAALVGSSLPYPDGPSSTSIHSTTGPRR